MTLLLIKLGIRLLAFTGVFWFATWPRKGKDGKPVKPPPAKLGKDGKPLPTAPAGRIVIQPRWAIPLVGFLFAGLNLGLYWLLRPILDLATLRTFSIVMPFIVNGLLLWGTARIVEKKKWLKIDGVMAAVWMAAILTVTHGVLWVSLDYVPKHW